MGPREARTGRPAGKNAKLFESLPGSTEDCQVPTRRSWRDAGRRMATVLHDEPSTGGGEMVLGGDGFPASVEWLVGDWEA